MYSLRIQYAISRVIWESTENYSQIGYMLQREMASREPNATSSFLTVNSIDVQLSPVLGNYTLVCFK